MQWCLELVLPWLLELTVSSHQLAMVGVFAPWKWTEAINQGFFSPWLGGGHTNERAQTHTHTHTHKVWPYNPKRPMAYFSCPSGKQNRSSSHLGRVPLIMP